MKEIWKDIKGYEGLYMVSSLGKVKSLDHYVDVCIYKKAYGKALHKGIDCRLWTDKDGYLIVNLSKDGVSRHKRVHRLVAEAFIPHVTGKVIVNHKNGIKSDNRVANLEWATTFENAFHANRILKVRHKKGIAVRQYDLNGNFIAIYKSMSDAGKAIKRSSALISGCCKGKIDKAGGYRFRIDKEG